MKREEMNKIILKEELDLYAKFYPNTIYYGENCISYKVDENNKYEILAMGERGKVAFHYNGLEESEACTIILEYLRDSKFLAECAEERKKKIM